MVKELLGTEQFLALACRIDSSARVIWEGSSTAVESFFGGKKRGTASLYSESFSACNATPVETSFLWKVSLLASENPPLSEIGQ